MNSNEMNSKVFMLQDKTADLLNSTNEVTPLQELIYNIELF